MFHVFGFLRQFLGRCVFAHVRLHVSRHIAELVDEMADKGEYLGPSLAHCREDCRNGNRVAMASTLAMYVSCRHPAEGRHVQLNLQSGDLRCFH